MAKRPGVPGKKMRSAAAPKSAAAKVGPHLLGRVYVADRRDWHIEQLLRIPQPGDDLLGKTVQQVLDDGTYFSSWPAILVFWRWAKTKQPSGGPTPPPAPAPSTAVQWADAIQLDQGQTGHCVGFGWAAWGNTAPVQDEFTNKDGDAIYYRAKVIDGEPKQENGSTVRSGAKAMQQLGRVGAYAFASALDEVKTWLLTRGPVVCGTDWTNDMFNPDANGFIAPTGAVAGGHCYLALGYDPSTDVIQFDNSWGSSWGKSGRFFMKANDWNGLFSAKSGEACVALELPK